MSTVAASFLDDNGVDRLDGTITTRNPLVSGALPTVSLSSTTAAQVSTTRNVTAVVAITNDATNNAATCKVELSPDNSTFSTLLTVSYAAAVNNTGAIVYPLTIPVPAGWWVKLTVTHAAITSTTYY
jgi:hypothetical protein